MFSLVLVFCELLGAFFRGGFTVAKSKTKKVGHRGGLDNKSKRAAHGGASKAGKGSRQPTPKRVVKGKVDGCRVEKTDHPVSDV